MQPQPDPRIHKIDLGTLEFNGQKYVIHDKAGCPRNACIERCEEGYLRCWACYTPLNDEAAQYVEAFFKETDRGTFISE
jgi:hypothetical protein